MDAKTVEAAGKFSQTVKQLGVTLAALTPSFRGFGQAIAAFTRPFEPSADEKAELDVARDAILGAGWQPRNIEQHGSTLVLVAPGEVAPLAVFTANLGIGEWLAAIPERSRASIEADAIEENFRVAAEAMGLDVAVRAIRDLAWHTGTSDEATVIALGRLEAELRAAR